MTSLQVFSIPPSPVTLHPFHWENMVDLGECPCEEFWKDWGGGGDGQEELQKACEEAAAEIFEVKEAKVDEVEKA